MTDPHRAIAASNLERVELVAEVDQALLADLQVLQQSLETLPKGIPDDKLGPLVDAGDEIKKVILVRVGEMSASASVVAGVLRHLDEAIPDDRPAILRTQETVLETMAATAQLLALAITVTNDIDRRLREGG